MTVRMAPFARGVSRAVLIIAAFTALLPVGLMLLNSFKTNEEILINPLALPERWMVTNYTDVWFQADLGPAMINSVVIAAMTVMIICVTSSMAAYALARKAVRGWKVVTFWLLATTTIPAQLFIFPLYFIFARLGLVGSGTALAFLYAAIFGPFSIFLLRSYFMNVPVDAEECARVDGADKWQIFFRIVFPMVFPGMLTVALIVGLYAWNEFLLSLTFLPSRGQQTIVVRFYSMQGQFSSNRDQLMAAATIIIFPILVFFVLLQRRFIEGMTAGSVKG